jgi:2-keto-4-pentenoate hydratase/2-oxohepta-3-ene-1,7-dioic acid hydratase in catechol pathway
VIGKTGRDIPEEEALDYVLGYTASNDVSARDLQFLTAQWSFSKGLDGSCPIGEYLSDNFEAENRESRIITLTRPSSRVHICH